MNEKELEFSLKSIEADVAMEALARRERGEPPHPESPLGEQDVAAIRALAVDLDEGFYERKAAQLIGALREPDGRELGSLDRAREERAARQAGAARDAGVARATRTRRIKQALGVVTPLLAAAGVMLWLFPLGELGPVVEPVEVTDNLARGADPGSVAAPTSTTRIAADGCLTVRVPLQKSAAQLSDDVSTRTYLVSADRTIPWKLALQPNHQGALKNTAGCQALPPEVKSGRWDLVVLVGYGGQLLVHGTAALHAAVGGGNHGSYSGIQYVRQSLELSVSPAEPMK